MAAFTVWPHCAVRAEVRQVSPDLPPAEALKELAVLEAMLKSAQSGRAERVECRVSNISTPNA